MNSWVYILECADFSLYTGSTINLIKRIQQHKAGYGANHTKTRLPVTLVYFECFKGIYRAFIREKQIQGWSRAKKQALIEGNRHRLKEAAQCINSSNHRLYRKLMQSLKSKTTEL